jgi:hydroxyacylglutathione hydrolase
VGEIETAIEQQKLPFGRSDRIAVTCNVGHRASLGVSSLLRRGYKHVWNLLGGMTAWSALGLATQRGPATR